MEVAYHSLPLVLAGTLSIRKKKTILVRIVLMKYSCTLPRCSIYVIFWSLTIHLFFLAIHVVCHHLPCHLRHVWLPGVSMGGYQEGGQGVREPSAKRRGVVGRGRLDAPSRQHPRWRTSAQIPCACNISQISYTCTVP